MGILSVIIAASLAACSDDSDDPGDDGAADPSAPPTEVTVDCDRFEDTAAAITQAQVDLYSGTGATDAMDTLVAELEALKEDAPADVRDALTGMAAAFRDAEEFLANPTPEKQAELADLAPQLEADGRTITDYVTSHCD